MEPQSRREFLADVGKGMLVAGIGSTLCTDLGLKTALAAPGKTGITFGKLEPLVDLLQQTPLDKLVPTVVEKIAQGTEIRTLVSAGALANARAFGGEDYIGFHTFMALAPAYEMSKEMPADRRALPVIKVLYRNSQQMQATGRDRNEVLHHIEPGELPSSANGRQALREVMLSPDMEKADRRLAALMVRDPQQAYNDLQALIQEDTDVHRTVLAYRAWNLLDLTGREHALTSLRLSVHYCVKQEANRIASKYGQPSVRKVLPELIDKYQLAGRSVGNRKADDAWIEKLTNVMLGPDPTAAAEAVADALAAGFSPDSIGEALSLAATERVLRDPGRSTQQAQPGKGVGSVHGDSIGVHASDSMNAWRNMAKVSSAENVISGLIVAGYHVAVAPSRDFRSVTPYPTAEQREAVRSVTRETLIKEIDGAIRENNQFRAAALASRAGELGMPARPIFEVMLRYATSEDGALHAEKYYGTVKEEFGRSRPANRWKHLVALARVTASEYGKRAPGYDDACRLLRIA